MSFPRSLFPAIAAAVVATLPVVAPAIADAPAIRIAYGDLNLSTPAGIDQLYSRIKHAAAQYCEPTRVSTGTRLNPTYDSCVKDAIAMTVQKVNVKGLSTLHADRSGSAGHG